MVKTQSPLPAQSAQTRLSPGDVISDRYRLERDVERTEIGVVYEATDIKSNREVAVEVASSIEEPRARRKWERDAMLAQRIEGEHVLRVLDVGTLANGVPYAVRESAVCSLESEVLAKGALPLPQAVAWTLEAAEAVAEAHALGMAHGDLRLANIFLARGEAEPSVKVAWTSAAKAEGAAREDVARDIAGLGVMLRVLATGHTDMEAEGAQTLPDTLARTVARALSEDPTDKFNNLSEFARSLSTFAPPGHSSARTITFLLSRAGIVGASITRRPSDPPPISVASTPPAARDVVNVVTSDDWFARGARVTPVGPLYASPDRSRRGLTFALVSLALLAAVVGGTWLLFQNGKLPHWTGTAPPEEQVGTSEITSGPTGDPNTLSPAEAAAIAKAKEADEANAANAASGESAANAANATNAAQQADAKAKAEADAKRARAESEAKAEADIAARASEAAAKAQQQANERARSVPVGSLPNAAPASGTSTGPGTSTSPAVAPPARRAVEPAPAPTTPGTSTPGRDDNAPPSDTTGRPGTDTSPGAAAPTPAPTNETSREAPPPTSPSDSVTPPPLPPPTAPTTNPEPTPYQPQPGPGPGF